MVVYKITNIKNGKVYIGQTNQTIEERFRKHMYLQCYYSNSKFYRAVREYGPENFKIEALEEATTQEELDEKEVKWIKYYDSVNKGYNSICRPGKKGGDTLTNHPELEAIRKFISFSKLGHLNPNATKVRAINLRKSESIDFDSFSECQEYFGIKHHSIIGRRCRGEVRKPYKDEWMFEYID